MEIMGALVNAPVMKISLGVNVDYLLLTANHEWVQNDRRAPTLCEGRRSHGWTSAELNAECTTESK
jgi:hypothetical protein